MGTFCDKYGREQNNVIIEEMVHSPSAEFNLFSLTKRLDEGWTLGGNKDIIWISKGDKKVVFDIKIKTPKGAIFAAYFQQNLIASNEVAAVVTDKKKDISADTAHGLVGHIKDADRREIAKYLVYNLARKLLTPCGACAEAKAKQMSLPSRTTVTQVEVVRRNVETKVNSQVYVDMSLVKSPKLLQCVKTKLGFGE